MLRTRAAKPDLELEPPIRGELLNVERLEEHAESLEADQIESYFQPSVSDERGTLFEHCARALDRSLKVGVHGLPLIGTGDWNDGMNRVGHEGRGESMWLGWFLHTTLWELARDDGTPLGSAGNTECRIESIAQSWAVLSGAADPARAARAMAAVEEYLVRRDQELVLLFIPPFDRAPLDPGYIKGYPPGVRENGGQYSHAAMWSVMALAALGDGDKAGELFSILMIAPLPADRR